MGTLGEGRQQYRFRAQRKFILSESEQDCRYRNTRWLVQYHRSGIAILLAKSFVVLAVILTFSLMQAVSSFSKDYSRHPAIYDPSPATAYEPAYPTVYEPAPSRKHQPVHRGYQTVEYDHVTSRDYLENFLHYFWYWFWCNIILILIIVFIVWLIFRIYYAAIINVEFARASAALDAANLAAAKPILNMTRSNLPV
jgi:hypothetical protein